MPESTIFALHVALPKKLGVEGAADPMDRPWRTGIFKDPVHTPLWLGRTNLEGDGQGDTRHHGGPEKAVCVYPAAHYSYWRTALGLPDMEFGAFGENFTIDTVTEPDVCIGDSYRVGSAVVQISQPRQPCWRLARRWRIKDLALRVQQTGFTGWYFRVLQEGEVEPHSTLEPLDRPYPHWTIERANQVMHRDRRDIAAARELGSCPLLSENWRATLAMRVESGQNPDPERRLIGPNAG